MKVYRVIVDEVPKSCIDTDNLEKSCRYLKYGNYYLCEIMDLPIEPVFDPLVERPRWCPLVVNNGATIDEIAEHYEENKE